MAQYRHEMERRLQEKEEEIEAIRYVWQLKCHSIVLYNSTENRHELYNSYQISTTK